MSQLLRRFQTVVQIFSARNLAFSKKESGYFASRGKMFGLELGLEFGLGLGLEFGLGLGLELFWHLQQNNCLDYKYFALKWQNNIGLFCL